MDEVETVCGSCEAQIGVFYNCWARIGKGYISPIVDAGKELAVTAQGPLRLGEPLTLVHGCRLQDIACARCGAVLGLRCAEVPVNHVLDKDQVLLRTSVVRTVYGATGAAAEVVVKRFLQLREQPGSSGARPDGHAREDGSPNLATPQSAFTRDGDSAVPVDEMVDLVQIRADLEGQREDIDRIDTTGFKVISRLSDSVAQLETGVDRLGKGLNDHRADLRGNQDDLASLKTEMRQSSAAVDAKLNMLSVALKAEIRTAAASAAKNARQDAIEFSTELRADLAAAQDDLRQTRRELEEIRACMSSNAGLREYTAEVAAVRKQVVDLGKDVEQLRKAIVDRKEPSSSAFLSRELDILASNLAKIGNRASQVETLQMELDILKGRVERMEGSWQDGEGDDSRTIARQSQDSLRNARLSGRKRSLPNLGNADRFDVRGAATASSSKRQALSSETDQPCPSSPAADEAIQVADTRENANASDKQRPSRGEGGLRKKPQRRGPRKSGPF